MIAIKKIKTLVVILVALNHYNTVSTYNLSPKPNTIFVDPNLATSLPKLQSSYFGFSLNLRPQG